VIASASRISEESAWQYARISDCSLAPEGAFMILRLMELIGRGQSLAELLANSPDYWHLLCGLTLIVLAVICYFLAGRVKE
jgi:hypothetical protein